MAEIFFAIGPRYSEGTLTIPPSGTLVVPNPQNLIHGNPTLIAQAIGKYSLYAQYESMVWDYSLTSDRVYKQLLQCYPVRDPRVWIHIYDPLTDFGGWFSATMSRPVIQRAPGLFVAGRVSLSFSACKRYSP